MSQFSVKRSEELRVYVPILRDPGYTELITYTATGIPAGVDYTFDPPSSVGTASDNLSTVLIIKPSLSAALGITHITVGGTPNPKAIGEFDLEVKTEYIPKFWEYSFQSGEFPGSQFQVVAIVDSPRTTSAPTTTLPPVVTTTTIRPAATMDAIPSQAFQLPGQTYNVTLNVNKNGWATEQLSFSSYSETDSRVTAEVSRPGGGFLLLINNPYSLTGYFVIATTMTNNVTGETSTVKFGMSINPATTAAPVPTNPNRTFTIKIPVGAPYYNWWRYQITDMNGAVLATNRGTTVVGGSIAYETTYTFTIPTQTINVTITSEDNTYKPVTEQFNLVYDTVKTYTPEKYSTTGTVTLVTTAMNVVMQLGYYTGSYFQDFQYSMQVTNNYNRKVVTTSLYDIPQGEYFVKYVSNTDQFYPGTGKITVVANQTTTVTKTPGVYG